MKVSEVGRLNVDGKYKVILTNGVDSIITEPSVLEEKESTGEWQVIPRWAAIKRDCGLYTNFNLNGIRMAILKQEKEFGGYRKNTSVEVISNIKEIQVNKMRALGYKIEPYCGMWVGININDIKIFSYNKIYADAKFSNSESIKLKSLDLRGLDFSNVDTASVMSMRLHELDINDLKFGDTGVLGDIYDFFINDSNIGRLKLGKVAGRSEFRISWFKNSNIGTIDASKCRMEYVIKHKEDMRAEIERIGIKKLIVDKKYKQQFEDILSSWRDRTIEMEYV